MLKWWNIVVDTSVIHRESSATSSSQSSVGNRSTSHTNDALNATEPLFQEDTRKWKFTVKANTDKDEVICVTGNCKSLGNWKHNECFKLKRICRDQNFWHGVADIPLNRDVGYRYVVCIFLRPKSGLDKTVFIRRWETHYRPRFIRASDENQSIDTLGHFDEAEKLERGWLTSEVAIQLKLFNKGLQISSCKLKGRQIYIKITPVNLFKSNNKLFFLQENNGSHEDIVSKVDVNLGEINFPDDTWPVVEIAVMNENEREFRVQNLLGRKYNLDEFLIFQMFVDRVESVALLIDFFCYPTSNEEGEPPFHVGYCYILTNSLVYSEGQISVPITSTRHKPIGTLTLHYILVKPVNQSSLNLSETQKSRWDKTWFSLNRSQKDKNIFRKHCAQARENSIASLKRAASHGSDFVVFEVQLSKDLIPVLFNDFYVSIANKQFSGETIKLNIKDMSFKQLQMLRSYRCMEKPSSIPRFLDEDEKDNQLFPSLQLALESLDKSIGFIIEIKWTHLVDRDEYQLVHPFDLNLYIDTVLEIVLNECGQRDIVFSSFHPDVCSIIRLKQNKFPVMFLSQGITNNYPIYPDIRCQNRYVAINFAVSMDILGVNMSSEDLTNSHLMSFIKNAGLVIFCWADGANDLDIYDKLDKLDVPVLVHHRTGITSSNSDNIFRLKEKIMNSEQRDCIDSPLSTQEDNSSAYSKSLDVDSETSSSFEAWPPIFGSLATDIDSNSDSIYDRCNFNSTKLIE